MIGKWIKKGEKLAKKGLKVCVGITERLFFVQKPVRLLGACQQSMLVCHQASSGLPLDSEKRVLLSDLSVRSKNSFFFSKLRGYFGFWTSISQGNIKGDQWATFKPLKAPP